MAGLEVSSGRAKLWLQRLELGALAVDYLEHNIVRLHLPVRQELDVAEHRPLDWLAADRLRNGLESSDFVEFTGCAHTCAGGGAHRGALIGSRPIGLRVGGRERFICLEWS